MQQPWKALTVNFGPGGDDLGLSDPLGLSGRRERLLETLREDNVCKTMYKAVGCQTDAGEH